MNDSRLEKATFAMGCFWGPEDFFRKIKGVVDTTVGYTGGSKKDPTYEDVCTGTTGHAEAIEIMYDPSVITYAELLDLFWEHHDPSAYHMQGPDVGEQYRAAIFTHDDEQMRQALESKERFVRNHAFSKPIVTEILPATEFYPAEEYHQDYSLKHDSYVCHI